MENQRPEPDREMSLAEGLRIMNTKGALVVPGVKLNKKRARIIISLINEHRHEIALRYEKEGEEDDFCAALQWMANHIWKRWSQSELYSDADERPKKAKRRKT